MLIKRIKYAGDIFEALVKQCEWDIDTASAFLESIPDAPNANLRAKGEWIIFGMRGIYGNMYACSECQAKYDGQSNFCPNCGADMRPTEDRNV